MKHVSVIFRGMASGMVLWAVTGSIPLFADAADAGDPSPGSDQLSEVVVTARFTREAIQNSPLAISSVSNAQIEALGMTNVSDVAQVVPNVTFQPTGDHYGKGISAYIRGVGQSDSSPAQSPAVGFYIDDVYVGSIAGANTALFDVQDVEVLRGPQGTLFGANSESGAVRIRNIRPKGDNSGYVEVGYGSYNHEIGKGVFDIPLIADKLFLRAGVTVEKQDGYEDLVDYACAFPGNPYTGTLKPFATAVNSCVWGHEGGTDTVGLKAALRLLVSDTLEVNLNTDYTNDTSENPATKLLVVNTASGGLATANALFNHYYGGLGYGPWFKTPNIYKSYATYTDPINGERNNPLAPYRGFGVAGTIDWDATQDIHVKSVSALRSTDTEAVDSNAAPVPIVEADQKHHARQISEEIDIGGSAFSKSLDWTGGLFYFDNKGYVNGNIDIPIIPAAFIPPLIPFANQYGYLNFIADETVHDQNHSAFLHAIYRLTDKLEFEGGVRYTHESKTFTLDQRALPSYALQFPITTNTSITKRPDEKIGVDYKWTPDFMTYASFATGFKSGGVNPEATQSAAQITPFGPEDLKNYEVGAKTEWFDHHLRVNGDLFYMIYTGLQLTFVNGELPVEGNVGRAIIDGAELEVEARPTAALLINGSASYLHYELKSCAPGCISDINTGGVPPGAVAPQTPKLKVSLGAQYAFDVGGSGSITPRLDFAYQSMVFNDPTNDPLAAQGGYGVANFHLTWSDALAKWTAAVAVTNLTNKLYYTTKYDFYPNGTITGNPGRPREALVTLRRVF